MKLVFSFSVNFRKKVNGKKMQNALLMKPNTKGLYGEKSEWEEDRLSFHCKLGMDIQKGGIGDE